MKYSRKILCALLAAALLILSIVPAFADGELSVSWGKDKVYLSSNDGSSTRSYSASLNGVTTKNKITAVKSSKKSVIAPRSINHWSSSTQYLNEDRTSSSSNASVYFDALKKGKSTLSFKVDGKTFKKTVEVLAYTNPLSSFKITGLSSSNLKSKFAKSANFDDQQKANVKAGKVTATAASGWKLTRLEWSGDSHYRYYSYYDGVKSISLPVPKMAKDNYYYIYITAKNVKNDATLDLRYSLRG